MIRSSAPEGEASSSSYVKHNVHGIVFELPPKYIPPIHPLGRGAYGFVCGAVDAEAREEVAIKKIANAFESKLIAKRTLQEIKLLKHMNHENIIPLRTIITPPRKESFNDVYMVFDMMDADLNRIIRSKQPLNLDHCKYFVYQLLRGLKYIHSANVLHRDLKPNNLFVNENCDLKIGDFGMSRSASDADFMTEYVVTRWYRAPELLLNWSGYTSAIDVWSVGCIMAEIINREPLFPGRDRIHQMRLIMEVIGTPDDSKLDFLQSDKARKYLKQLPMFERKSFSEKFPEAGDDAVDLLGKMLVFHPRERVSVEEALAHPFLASLHDVDDEPVCETPFSFDLDRLSEEELKDITWKETQHMP